MRYLKDASLLSLKYVADKIIDHDSCVITVGEGEGVESNSRVRAFLLSGGVGVAQVCQSGSEPVTGLK